MLKEFREFAMRGNVIDLAVGIIIGAAFGKIVTSFVNDIIMPPIGLLLGNADFSALFLNLSGGGYATLAEAESCRRARHQIRCLHQHGARFRDRRVRDLRRHSCYEQAQEKAGSCAAGTTRANDRAEIAHGDSRHVARAEPLKLGVARTRVSSMRACKRARAPARRQDRTPCRFRARPCEASA